MMRYTAKELDAMPTLCTAQTDDLKIDTGDTRVWLARTDVTDGEPYDNRVSIEKFDGQQWSVVENYPG